MMDRMEVNPELSDKGFPIGKTCHTVFTQEFMSKMWEERSFAERFVEFTFQCWVFERGFPRELILQDHHYEDFLEFAQEAHKASVMVTFDQAVRHSLALPEIAPEYSL